MYSYLQNVNTNVSNAKRNIPKGTPLTNIVNSYDGENLALENNRM